MMVIQHTSPKIRFSIANGIPEINSQKMLAIVLIAPPPYLTSLPKGQKDSVASLKHCRPIGMPIIVMHQSMPAKIQDRPLISPPNTNHNIFPKNFIII